MKSIPEAARSLGVHPQTLRTQIKFGKLQATKLARDWFVTDDEVERYRRESLRPIQIAPKVIIDEPADAA